MVAAATSDSHRRGPTLGMAAGDDARARIQRLLVTGDNRLKQGVAPEKVRESYEQALAVAREAGLEEAVRPLVELRLADLDAAAAADAERFQPTRCDRRRVPNPRKGSRSPWERCRSTSRRCSAPSRSSVVGSLAIVSADPATAAPGRVDRARLRPRAADRALRVRRGVGRALQPGRLARDVPRPAAPGGMT